MIPTTEEIDLIVAGSQENPDKELGTAENLLLTMSSIPEIKARLNLWSFKLDYDLREQVGVIKLIFCVSLNLIDQIICGFHFNRSLVYYQHSRCTKQ